MKTPNDEAARDAAEDDRERRVRERANQLWVKAGRPEGQDTEFWLRAENEIDDEDRNGPKTP